MVLRSLQVLPYRLTLDPPFRWRAGEIAERDGVLVRVEDEAGRVGWGDAAPLPGFSAETRDEASEALEGAFHALEGRNIEWASGADVVAVLDAEFGALVLPRSARYGLDLALAELAAAALGRPLPLVLSAAPASTLWVAALLDSDPAAVVELAAERVGNGYRALKMKLGRLDPESDAEVVRDVRRRVGPDVEIRGDANRGWSPDQGAAFVRLVAAAGLSYVEEPLAREHVPELAAFARETGLPVALDESLAEGGADAIGDWVEAVVLKPTVLGGIAATLRMAGIARAAGVRSVMSAAFESGVGQRGVAALAAVTGAEAAGLDPYSRLRTDVVVGRVPLDQPTIDLEEVFRRPLAVRVEDEVRPTE